MRHSRRSVCGAILALSVFIVPCMNGSAAAADESETDNRGLFGGVVGKAVPALSDRVSLDFGWKFWVAKWQAQGNAREINATRTSDTTTMTGPSITGSLRLREDDLPGWRQVGSISARSGRICRFRKPVNRFPAPATGPRRSGGITPSSGRSGSGADSASSAGTIICNSGSAAAF